MMIPGLLAGDGAAEAAGTLVTRLPSAPIASPACPAARERPLTAPHEPPGKSNLPQH
jgi:hypothetical protein